MAALRCSACGHSWPLDPDLYRICPDCEGRTDRVNNERPMEAEHALSLRNQLLFSRFYAGHCERLGQTMDGDIRPVTPLHELVCSD